MARADEFSTGTKSPVKKYLKWDSAEKSFKYYDKEANKNVYVGIPVKFISLKEMATIGGFHEPSQSGIYSNELPTSALKTKELTVKTFKGITIAQGIYGDIKPNLAAAGAKFAISLYAMLNGELVCISLMGSSFSAWYDFAGENRKDFLSNTIEIKATVDKKKGATKYSEPVFTLGGNIDEADNVKAEKAYDELTAYLTARGVQQDAPQAIQAEEVIAPVFAAAPEVSDLPF